jgi:beta-N-acetylhexosaminidase
VIRPGREARRIAGRLCLVDFSGTDPTARLERLITERHIGGVVLFRKNVASAVQVAALTAGLQGVARAAGAPAPWVSIDHEGGGVNRFGLADASPPAVTPLPSAMALGAAGDPLLAQRAGRVAGTELRAMGIHLNFAPVMDVNNNPANPVIGARAFGESPALVETMGLAYIRGLQETGVGATAKHFPGHGDVTVDSHLALPRVEHGPDRLEAIELPPFAAAVRADVAAVMTAHIVFPGLDPTGVPATLSAAILSGILRERWGYQGLICSDSLAMRAIVDTYGAGDAAVAAVRAGCDLLLALGPDAMQDEILEALACAIETGVGSGAQAAAAAARVAQAAPRWGVGLSHQATLGDAVGNEDHMRAAREIAEHAVTLVRDRAGEIPLRAARVGVVAVGTGPDGHGPPDFASVLREYHPAVVEMAPRNPADRIDRIIAVTCTRGVLPAAQAAAVQDLHRRLGNRLIVLATGDPYDLLQIPDVPVYLVTYSPDRMSLDAAARVLVGRIPARGTLPVTLPGQHAAGHAWSPDRA